jgi:acyl carrier protein
MKKEEFISGLSELFEYEVNLSSDLDLDSIDIMGLVVFLDENFSIQKTTEQLSEISSVKDIVEIVGSDKYYI